MHISGYNTSLRALAAVITAMWMLLAPVSVSADEAQHTEYRIKTAFLYNFSRFVIWPPGALQDRSEFSLCTLGETRFQEQLDTLVGKTVHNKAIVVKRYAQAQDILNCHLVFIGEQQDLDEVLWTLKGLPVLTVSNVAGFTEKGGIIQFKLVENKIRFRINAEAARNAGLTVSSKLLSLAIEVTGNR